MYRLCPNLGKGFINFAPIWVKASSFPAALYCFRLSKSHLYHTSHTPVLTLTAARAANRCFSLAELPHMHSRCSQLWSIRFPRGGEVPLSCNVFSWLGGHLLPGMTAPLSVPFCNRLHEPIRPSISGASSSPLLPDVSASSM